MLVTCLAHRLSRVALAIGVTSLSSCGYVVDRALDFTDQYCFAVGAGSVTGLRFRSLGLYDTGLMIGVKPRATSLGWRYGTPLFLDTKDQRFDADQAEVIRTTSLIGADYGGGSYQVARRSWALFPAIFTWVDSTPTDYEWHVPEEGDLYDESHWLWSSYAFSNVRYAQVHAFDIESEIGLIVYLDVGYSIGEFADFLLGFVLIDIAKDDDRL